jgi:hypothetical protein
LLAAQAPHTAGGALAHAVRQLTSAPAVLGEASRAIGNVGATATRLAGSTPAAITPLLASLQPFSLTLPSLPVLPAVPSLPAVPAVPALPALPLPIFTLPPQPLPLQEPTGLWPPSALMSGGALEGSAAVSQQGAAPVSVAPAPGLESPGAATMTSASEQTAAPLDRAPTEAASTRPLAAAEATPATPSLAAAAATGYPYASATRTNTAAALSARPARSPAPSPGGISTATGAIAGTSIPIFLTLAGLLLLATPRVRRVLRLLGESWRLSPLALIPERPG